MDLSHIVIIVDSLRIESWKCAVIKKIITLDFVEKVNIINIDSDTNLTNKSIYPQNKLLRLIEKILFGVEYEALSLQDVSTFGVAVEDGKESTAINASIVINLSSKSLPKNIKVTTLQGVWRYFFGDYKQQSSHHVGRSEYLDRKGYVDTGIIAENWENHHYILHQKKSALDHLSMCVGIENVLWGCVNFIPTLLEKLHRYGEDYLNNKQVLKADSGQVGSRKSGMLKEWFICIKSYSRQIIVNSIFPCKWILLIDKEPADVKPYPQYEQIKKHQKLLPPRGKFWADPFIVNKGEDTYIFFEELEYKNWKGYISYMKVDSNDGYSHPTKILERPYHLSYPFIFSYDNEMYMIPESRENNTMELYHCENFPDQWTFKHKVMEGLQACDTTLLEYQGKWWMFTVLNSHEKCMNAEDLYIFYADSPLAKDWTPHRNNPVISDATIARSAGNFFIQNGKLYRPSQNCSGIYGKSLNINEVIELTADSYKEKKIYEDTATWSLRVEGVHTYNQTEKLVVSDAQYYQFLLW